MSTLFSYSETNKTATFPNGKTVDVYSKQTKSGIRYFYWSMRNGRFMPLSKIYLNK